MTTDALAQVHMHSTTIAGGVDNATITALEGLLRVQLSGVAIGGGGGGYIPDILNLLLTDLRVLPILGGALSLVVLFVNGIYRRVWSKPKPLVEHEAPKYGDPKITRRQQGFVRSRVVACMALWCIALLDVLHTPEAVQYGLLGVYSYILLLLFLPKASYHAPTLLLLLLLSYLARDVFPLATFTLVPLDLAEGPWLWVKIALLGWAGFGAPILSPQAYVPVDKENPRPPSPDQTASLLSLITFAFLDRTIWAGYVATRVGEKERQREEVQGREQQPQDPEHGLGDPERAQAENQRAHLALDALPPLADYDDVQGLVARTNKHLLSSSHGVPKARQRHLFFSLLHAFPREVCALAVLLVVQAGTTFVAPLGINRLLTYIESPEQVSLRPWFWILTLFVGPLASSLVLQRYIYVSVRTVTQIEAILTHHIFEHALRIRLKAEVEHKVPIAGATTPVTELYGADTPVPTTDGSRTLASGEGHTVGEVASAVILEDASAAFSTTPTTSKAPVSESTPTPAAQNLVGKISSLITTDMSNIRDSIDFLTPVLFIPLHLILAIWFLYVVLGWSAFVGLGVIVILLPVPGYFVKLVQDVEVVRMQKTDARVQGVTETLSILRMVKLFGWESKVGQDLDEKREEELTLIKKKQILNMFKGITNYMTPLAAMTLVMKQPLNASKVFSSMSIFDILRGQFFLAFHTISQLVEGKLSLERINDFLCNTDLLDSFMKDKVVVPADIHSDEIGFRDASFTWSGNLSDISTSGDRFVLTISDELSFKRGCINLIVGPTGSGKTSLLMALLGEMHFIPCGPQSSFNLPRGSGVAYAAQESWVLNDTIKNNILFNSSFDEARYKKVLHQCCLERDLTLFKAGDQTEVGERGLTLSGGQKARITLARAIYSRAEVLLLDDVFAALDVHTAKWISDKCFTGDIVKGRTILLVTHNLALAHPIAEYLVTMRSGTVFSHGPISENTRMTALQDLEKLVERNDESFSEHEEDPKSILQEDNKMSDGTLIVAEEIELGRVKWKAFNLFLSALGGRSPLLFFFAFIGGVLLGDALFAGQTWYLGYWASQYDDPHGLPVPALHYIGVFGLITFVAILLYIMEYIVYLFGSIRASRKIHKLLMQSILGTTLRWLDVTPTSRITARCTQDIGAVDGPLAARVQNMVELTFSMVAKLVPIVIITPLFLGPSIAVTVLGIWLCSIYMASQLSIKREMSNAKAPVLGHFTVVMNGIVSIRAYGAQDVFTKESHIRINRYTRSARTFYNLTRWVTVRVDLLGALFTTSLAAYLVYFQSRSSSDTGFSLNMSVVFSSMILYWVMYLNDLEIQANSLERILGYLGIEQEPKPTKHGAPPAYWPASGDLRVENLSARYSPDSPEVLHDISFHVNSGERVGIVGRTGSGKSTLTLSLLRSILTTGSIYYDGILTNSVNIDALRSSITIIPQIPELLSGTLRQNLDPFGQFDDAVLNDALQAAGLFSLQQDDSNRKITLDTAISGSGSNLSVGQRQILALARAIVRGSKLLILDEATSAIDQATDSIIQSSLRHQLGKDVTLLTVAHRLHTIMDTDKIMVLDAGEIVEFGPPQTLLQNPSSMFRALVDESGDKEVLYALARAPASRL